MRTKKDLLNDAYREEGYAAIRSTETKILARMLSIQLEVLLDIRDILLENKSNVREEA